MKPNEVKPKGSLKLKPIQGRFFDIKPPTSGSKNIQSHKRADYFRFVMIAIVAFLMLGFYNAYVLGRQLFFENQVAAQVGYENIKNGVDFLMSRNASKAVESFAWAEDAFLELQKNTAQLITGPHRPFGESFYMDTTDKLISGAIDVAHVGKRLADLMSGFEELPQLLLSVVNGNDGTLLTLLKQKRADLDEIRQVTVSLQQKLTTLNEAILPDTLVKKLDSARSKIGLLLTTLLQADDAFDLAFRLLGNHTPHRYLVLLQNQDERRATGGFIGSYVVVDVNDGRILKMESKDVYETDGQLSDIVKAPPGIDRVAKRLYMRDANYSPDFPTSARQIMWFLEHSKGPSVDTIIAIDQSVIESLLRLTGPLTVPDTSLKVGADNFTQLISFYTEAKISRSVTPKQLLFDLIPLFQQKLGNIENMTELYNLAQSLIKAGHIQVYSNDTGIQKLISRFGLGGEMAVPEEKTDFLSVITTSIGGNKSDAYIHTNLIHNSALDQDGGIENELIIKKTHTWNHSADTRMENLIASYGTGKLTKKDLYYILGRGPNLDYMRVYVPLGSKLKAAKGIDLSTIQISEDLGYTVFAFVYGPVNAGASQEVSLSYQLPYKVSLFSGEYRFIAEPQAGSENVTLKKEIHLHPSLKAEVPGTLEEAFNQNKTFAIKLTGA